MGASAAYGGGGMVGELAPGLVGLPAGPSGMSWVTLLMILALPVVAFPVLAGLRPWGRRQSHWAPPSLWRPGVFFWYQVVWSWCAVIFVLALTSGHPHIQPVRAPSFVTVLSPWAIFGGLIGGITISIVGISRHAHEWDGARYAYWHLARPVLGLVTGSVAVLILLFVLRAMSGGGAGAVAVDPTKPYDGAAQAFMFVVAFVVGYREASFRELVKRVADLLFTKPEEEGGRAGVWFLPAKVELPAPSGSDPDPEAPGSSPGGGDPGASPTPSQDNTGPVAATDEPSEAPAGAAEGISQESSPVPKAHRPEQALAPVDSSSQSRSAVQVTLSGATPVAGSGPHYAFSFNRTTGPSSDPAAPPGAESPSAQGPPRTEISTAGSGGPGTGSSARTVHLINADSRALGPVTFSIQQGGAAFSVTPQSVESVAAQGVVALTVTWTPTAPIAAANATLVATVGGTTYSLSLVGAPG
ncbi:MAG: hypothetical protein KBB39_06595 [Phycicoccus sp.]|nr:hypothetical protein [Phycicoccus sp.]